MSTTSFAPASGQPVAEKASGREQHRFKQTLKDARAGQVEAQYQLGLMLANGSGIRRDLGEALGWIQRAAERGHAAAQYMLGTHFCAEPGTAPAGQSDDAKAFEWLFKAAAQGHPKAHWRMARLLRESHAALAAAHENVAASLGLAEAQVAVVEAGTGAADNPEAHLALRLQTLRRAAEQGLLGAQTDLGCLLLAIAAKNGESAAEVEGLRWLRAAGARRWPPAVLALIENGADATPLPSNTPDPVDAAARHALGCLWERGLAGLPVHRDEAARWYALAAAQGHAASELALGRLTLPVRSAAARAHFERAARAGSAEACWELAQWLSTHHATAADQLSATHWRLQAVHGGHPASLLALALCNDDSFGPLDTNLRDHALLLAAQAGLPEAQRLWASRLQALAGALKDHGQRQLKLEDAAQWLQRAARQGDAASLAALGLAYRRGSGLPANAALGLQLLHEAAHQGDNSARWHLALLQASGAKDVPQDLRAAMNLCREAAEAGYVPAQATLGVLCAASADEAEAVVWWRLAATAGDTEAQVNLAQAMSNGKGTPKDEAAAFHWLLKAAQAGLGAAQARVGLAYATGQGVVADPLAAHQWFFIARQSGDKSAEQNLKRSRSLLNAAGQEEAERRARDWLQRPSQGKQT